MTVIFKKENHGQENFSIRISKPYKQKLKDISQTEAQFAKMIRQKLYDLIDQAHAMVHKKS